MNEKDLNVSRPNFGTWLRTRLDAHNISIAELSRRTGIAYPNISAIIHSGKTPKPIQPEEATMRKIITGLRDLDALPDEAEAWAAAGYLVGGYKIVRAEGWQDVVLPEQYEDWPQELQEAMAFSSELTPDAQKYVFHVWREQARHHAELARKAKETEEQIKEAQAHLDSLKKQSQKESSTE